MRVFNVQVWLDASDPIYMRAGDDQPPVLHIGDVYLSVEWGNTPEQNAEVFGRLAAHAQRTADAWAARASALTDKPLVDASDNPYAIEAHDHIAATGYYPPVCEVCGAEMSESTDGD